MQILWTALPRTLCFHRRNFNSQTEFFFGPFDTSKLEPRIRILVSFSWSLYWILSLGCRIRMCECEGFNSLTDHAPIALRQPELFSDYRALLLSSVKEKYWKSLVILLSWVWNAIIMKSWVGSRGDFAFCWGSTNWKMVYLVQLLMLIPYDLWCRFKSRKIISLRSLVRLPSRPPSPGYVVCNKFEVRSRIIHSF